MGKCNDIDAVLRRHGTDQEQRYLVDLDPDQLELNDFDIEDWIIFAYNFAKHVNYFDVGDSSTPSGDWQDFFNHFNFPNSDLPPITDSKYKKLKDDITNLLSQFKSEGRLTPHLTLFICFLHLLELSKKRFNGLTKKHLDFYYKKILQVDKKGPIADQVNVIFELAKKSHEEQIINGTALNGGKDADGKQLVYKTNEELIVNKTTVSSLKSICSDIDGSELKASATSNTLDGKEEPLPEDEPYWYPFGYTAKKGNFTELPNATIGFALASPMFNLQEGLRIVEVTVDFEPEDIGTNKPKLADFKNKEEDIICILSIYGSGKEEWIGPLELLSEIKDKEEKEILYNTSIISTDNELKLKLAFQLDKDTDALVNYNQKALLEKYDTTFPLIKFIIDTKKVDEESLGLDFYRALVKSVVNNITVKVDVRDAESLLLENDFGAINVKKPFYPFTTQPVKGSNFYIDYPEVFSKSWTSLDVNLTWKNTPDDFKELYGSYLKDFQIGAIKTAYLASIIPAVILSQTPIVTGDSYFKSKLSLQHKEEWPSIDKAHILFTKNTDTEDGSVIFENNVTINNANTYDIDKAGPIRLSLQQSFLHELFPRLYALAITNGDAIIPNEPYTPLIETITLDYVAEESRAIKSQTMPNDSTPLDSLNTLESYNANRIQLFHIHPFGQSEEHNYLSINKREKGIKDIDEDKIVNTYLVPKYCKGGQLYIGLKDAEVLQSVSLLVQVLEGTENPLADTFKENEAIAWSILCDNKWKDLTDYIISNNTNNFLASGILKFTIPRETTDTNTLLPENYIWVRARTAKTYDAVCKVINIHAQAVLATFENNANELSHLKKGLEAGTIKKMITRIPEIKSVSQPYSSFGGFPKESDEAFYRRISERLRHKNRAITLWDYEHLILQQFPEIYKVKCLNHTKPRTQEPNSKDNFTSAGDVALVVIPDTVNKNVFDIYQPRVSQGLINKIATYINNLNTLHVVAEVINPDYEEVAITLEVKFYKGYDESYYKKQLNEDIIKFLSPWAFDDPKKIDFGVELHKSVLIDYLEKLSYVDYLQNVKIKKDGELMNNGVSPSTPMTILVSAKTHVIEPASTNCMGEKITETIECQI